MTEPLPVNFQIETLLTIRATINNVSYVARVDVSELEMTKE